MGKTLPLEAPMTHTDTHSPAQATHGICTRQPQTWQEISKAATAGRPSSRLTNRPRRPAWLAGWLHVLSGHGRPKESAGVYHYCAMPAGGASREGRMELGHG